MPLKNQPDTLKSPAVMIVFDRVWAGQGNKAPVISDALKDAIAQQYDVFFISHVHDDPADGGVAELFLKHNKDIVASREIWADGLPIWVPELSNRQKRIIS